MKLLKNSLVVVHALLDFMQARIALASWSVVGVSLVNATESQWIDERTTVSPEQRPASLPAVYRTPD